MKVPAGDAQKLQVADQVRTVDPCGLFDRDRLATYGQIAYVGPENSVDDCSIGVMPSGRPRLLARATIALAGTPPSPEETDTRQIAGETVVIDHIRNRDTSCTYKVPLRLPASAPTNNVAIPDVVEVPAVQYAMVQGFGFPTSALNCQVATETTAAVISALRDNRIPRRDRSAIQVPLTNRSPCELTAKLPIGYAISSFDAQTQPYTCSFKVDGLDAGRYGTTITADFQLRDAAHVLEPRFGQRLVSVEGYPAIREETSTESCLVTFPVGPVVDSYLPGTPASQSEIDGARHQVVVRLYASTCPVADRLASIAAELFGANR
ncbi:hypothetical protein [Nocardia sp. NPDC050710]|uniref:hypothetical protein n=1 Tax=Nocardia sp. NPDC050710 TaxID=3157220 RepID=UPI003404726C